MSKSNGDGIGGWLASIGLSKYAALFQEHEIDLDVISDLTDADLKDLEIPLGDRKRLLRAIEGADVQPARDGKSGAERRQITILMCDLVGSTELSARLDPEDLSEAIRTYQQGCAERIARWEGYIARYLGDGILAYFGWPVAHEDDAERAVRAGLELCQAVGRMHASDGSPLAVRVGIATGLVMVGELVGEGAARHEDVVGATPNLAARLQALAEPGKVVIAPETRQLVGGVFDLKELGGHRLKGFSRPVEAWQVERPKQATSRFEAHAGHHLTPLVGRDSELRDLNGCWETALTGQGQVAVVAGEAGIGKSRLIQSFSERLRTRRHASAYIQCSSHHTMSALHPIIDYFNRALRLGPEDDPSSRLESVRSLIAGCGVERDDDVPLLASLLSIPMEGRLPPLNMSPQRQRDETIDLIGRLIVALSREGPLLLTVEDAQWADPTTLSALDRLMELAAQAKVLTVITCRSDFKSDWVTGLTATRLDLRRLTRASALKMVGRVTGDKPLPDAVRDSILSTADGIPLFVEELTRALVESGQLRDAGTRYELRGSILDLAIPATLRDLLEARLDRMLTAKEVAQIGASIGRTFSAELVGRVLDRSEVELEDKFLQLCEAGILERRGQDSARRYVFKHALIQEAAYRSLLKSRRREIHYRIAHVLETYFPKLVETQPEGLARHFAEAGVFRNACDYLLAASRNSLRVSATNEAIAHLTRGLELVRSLPEGEGRDLTSLRLHASLGTAYMLAKGWAAPEVEAAYITANKLSHVARDATEAMWILWGIWVHSHVRGRIGDALAIGERLRATADNHGDSESLLVADMVSLQTSLYAGRFEAAVDYCARVEDAFRPAKHRRLINLYSTDLQLVALVHRSIASWILGAPDEASMLAAKSERLARSLEHPYSIAWSLTWGAMAYLLRGELDKLAAKTEEGISIARDEGFAYVAAMGTMARGWVDGKKGDLSAGIRGMQSGLESFEATGASIVVPYFRTLLAALLGEAGRREEALAALAAAERQIERWGEDWPLAEVFRVRGEVVAAGGDPDAAKASFLRGIEVARSQHALGWEFRGCTSLGHVLYSEGREAEARRVIDTLGHSRKDQNYV